MQFRFVFTLCWTMVTTCVLCGWPATACAEGSESLGVGEDHVLARLAAAEKEIQRLQQKLGDHVERFPPVTTTDHPVRPVAFQSEHASPLVTSTTVAPFESTASFANFEQDDDVVEEVIPVEPYGQEADELADGFDSNDSINTDVGLDFYGTPDFLSGLLIEGDNALMKIGGYVKADLIHDLDPIDSQDVFNTTTIPVDAEPRENSRFHARQSRLNFDARWFTERGMARVFVEGDFFGGSALEEETSRDRFRLRHAYGEIGSWIFGQTWSTFADVGAAPFTLDFEGAVSSISRRQAQVRYTTAIGSHEDALVSLAIEDARVTVEIPDSVEGEPRTESPDFVIRAKNKFGIVRLQAAAVFRELGFQKKGEPVATGDAWGFNFGGDARLNENNRIYSQIVWGEGIGSYKGLPDVVGDASGSAEALTVFGWMVGWTHNWSESLSSNFTYSANRVSPSMFQSSDDLRQVTYLAVNLIAEPVERVFVGAEYLYGTRQNVDGQRGDANRLQFSFGFFLP